ncbi:FAD-binding oxidoreductase (plasmid) [Aliiroseovarius crassostreae]|uniref:NAD(P)/FAD-dependent oxidoreductase n=1 Tax=Aliiroseovarius crassostreae TaxID=154981 RepID=UPI002208D71E|nr:FAD-dependent oxidoreductase [Aliiroseovarius crassostreae]UWP94004.1 FAD-binding oxidoreductase [Aliiroseovarius crassostreae]
MRRIYENLAYSDRPIRDRYWSRFLPDPAPEYPALNGEAETDFAVIGGGYAGLSAALQLAEAGADVTVLDAMTPGWGASGRNGGLVSLGAAKLDDGQILRRYGPEDARLFFDAERAAVDLVETYLERFALDVDRQSSGYTYLAHRPEAVQGLKEYGQQYTSRYGLPYQFIPKDEMPARGMTSPDFHGAVTLPIGFALNPMKFVLGLTGAVERAGVRIHSRAPVMEITPGAPHILQTPQGRLRARHLLICTNGYSSEDLPDALAGRYLPVQSNILVTRPMAEDELAAQGWTSDQMCVDSRTLLHYFRLLPDRRMLLGLRGSVRVTEAEMARTEATARADFDRMFPAWQQVETEYFWSGLICMTRNLVPFAGPVPGMDRAWAALGFHGGGVTMAPYAGALIADMALGRSARPHPGLMQRPLRRFELGRWRRSALPAAFAWYRLCDEGLGR